MKCSRCGTDNNDSFAFCARCGAALARRCASCQTLLTPGDTFCRGCGKPVAPGQPPAPPFFPQAPSAVTAATAGPARTGGKPNPMKKWILATVALVLVAALIWSYVLIFLLPSRNGGNSGGLTLGAGHHLVDATVGAEGGTISVEDGALGGLTIEVPENAYDGDTDFSVSMTEIKSDQFGDAFTAASPLITIDNGEVFSNAPVFITVPIEKTDDEFAMGFYYDRETGELEGLPLVSETNSEIVVMTCHFSEIVMSKVPKGRIVDDNDSGFRPGTDDMQLDNSGSVIAPGGFCSGQCLAELYYYCNKGRVGWEKPLYGLYDNNGKGKTPEFWQDDSFEIRLCSAIQNMYGNSFAGTALQDYMAHDGTDDALTYYAFAYSLMLTRKPSLIRLSLSGSSSGGHAMLVYRVTKDGLCLADPNATASEKPFLTLTREKGKAPKFEPYQSAANASDLAGGKVIDFDTFAYYGMFAMLDRKTVGELWSQLKSGKDPGAGLFPADTPVEVATNQDADGNYTATALRDGLVLDGPGMDNLGTSGSTGNLICRVNSTDPKVRLTLYVGTSAKELSADWNKTPKVTLKTGVNSFGILEERRLDNGEFSYINFRRFSVTYSQSPVVSPSSKPSPSPSPEKGDLAGTWSVSAVTTDKGGSAPISCIPDSLVYFAMGSDSTSFGDTFAVGESGGKYTLAPNSSRFNVNTISLNGSTLTATRTNSSTGSTITFTGTLSPGGTMKGTFQLIYGGNSACFVKGTWEAHKTD